MIFHHLTRILAGVLVVLIMAGGTVLAAPQPGVGDESTTPAAEVLVKTSVTPQFPTGIGFSASIPLQNGAIPDASSFFYRISADETMNLVMVPEANLIVDNDTAHVNVFVDLQNSFIPLGVSLSFQWELTKNDGVILSTAEETTLWSDTRFDWQHASSDQVTIYTYDMEPDFMSWMLSESQSTIDDLEQHYDLKAIAPLSIWIYPNQADFAATRQMNTRESIAGLSYPGASLIVAVVPDENTREFGRVIPHEISHQALFQATANPYAFPPLWLDEGLATHVQTGGSGHYARMVWRAERDGTLFDINSLNASFPFQPAQATLAYASSWSMVDFIEATFGPEGISRLIEALAMGLPSDDAIQEALGISSAELNAHWHDWISSQNSSEAFTTYGPIIQTAA